MDTPEKAARRVFGQRASLYTTSPSHTDPQVLARLVELCSPQPQWSVLDIATGTGHTAFALAPHVACVVGVDLTPEMLAEAERLQAERAVANVKFRVADVHHLPFETACFDLITCRRAAHHFSNIAEAMGEMRRVLRVGGRLVIDDRSVPDDDFVDACMNQLDRYDDESHIREYRPDEWRQMLETGSFLVDTVEPYTKHRPLTSLTDGVSPENLRKIQTRLDHLNARQRAALNLVEIDGQPHLNHWYVLIAAKRA